MLSIQDCANPVGRVEQYAQSFKKKGALPEQGVNQGETHTIGLWGRSSLKCCSDQCIKGSQKHHSLAFRLGEMAELCHGHWCAITLLDKLFLFGLHPGNRKKGLISLPNWTYSNVLQNKVSGGVFRQLVSCHQDYNACTAHLITADINSQTEYFYKIAWQYVRDRVNFACFTSGKIYPARAGGKVLRIKFPRHQSTGWWWWYALEDMNLDSFQK